MKEHKTLLQWKREIEESIVKCKKIESGLYPVFTAEYMMLENQLQMINDIIKQVDIQLSLSEDFECCQEVLNSIKGE